MANEKKGHDVSIIFIAPGVGTVTIDGVQMTCKNVTMKAGARRQTEVTVTIMANTINMPVPLPQFGQAAPQPTEEPQS